MVPTWKTKKGKISKFVDEGGYSRNERSGNWRLGVEKKNYFRQERCENIKNPYTNKNSDSNYYYYNYILATRPGFFRVINIL
jgi:hypothetical protein